MKFFQTTFLHEPLGHQLREARISRKLTIEKVSSTLHLSSEEIEGLEKDSPLDPRRARIQAISYLRFLGLDPSEFKDSLPPLPELFPRREKIQMRVENPVMIALQTLLAMLAPMGKFALILIITVMLLGSWGMMRQLSRIRSMPWVSYSYTVHDSSIR
jgi:transcriptional regulator with XRE-family HTH domain